MYSEFSERKVNSSFGCLFLKRMLLRNASLKRSAKSNPQSKRTAKMAFGEFARYWERKCDSLYAFARETPSSASVTS